VFGSFSKELRALFDRFTRIYSNVNKTLSVDLFLASGSIILTYGLQCVCLCPLLALPSLGCIRHAPIAFMMSIVIISRMPLNLSHLNS
jgi:hypothetical protein